MFPQRKQGENKLERAQEAGEQMAAGNGDLEVDGHGHGEGKMWNMDQTLDQPLGLEAERVSSMRIQKVSSYASYDVECDVCLGC